MRYDEIRAEELGGRGETGRACDGTAGLGSPGEQEEGRSPLCRGQREGESASILIFL